MAHVQIDSITSGVALDGESRVSFSAKAVDYTGAMAVWFRASIEAGGVRWEHGELTKGNASFVPGTELMEGFTDSMETVAVVTIEMVNANGASIGTAATADITLRADETLAKPEVSDGWATLAPYNGNTNYPDGVYVKGSRLSAVFDLSKVTFRYGASAAQTAQGRWSVKAGSNAAVTDGILFTGDALTVIIPGAGRTAVVCTVTDSRGFTADETFIIEAYEYAQPVLSGIEIYRSDASGNAGDTGTFMRIKADAAISDLGGANEIVEFYANFSLNGAETVTRTELESGSAVLMGAGSVVPARSYAVGIYLFDGCGGSAKYETIVSTVSAAFNILPGGKGAAFGRLAEKEKTLDVYDWNIETEGRISANNLYPVGSVYMSAYDTDPAELYGGTWNAVTTTGLPFNVWFRVPD